MAQATNPGLITGRASLVPYSVLLRVGLAKPAGRPAAGALLPTPFHPYLPDKRAFGGVFSVALSVTEAFRPPPLGVTQHPGP